MDTFGTLSRLPSELIHSILCGYCDGKSVSSLLTAAVSQEGAAEDVIRVVEGLTSDRILAWLQINMDRMNPNTKLSMLHLLTELRSAYSDKDRRVGRTLFQRIREVSLRLAFVDYIALVDAQRVDALGQLQFPIWAGKLRFLAPFFAENPYVEVEVKISSPYWRPELPQKWSASLKRARHTFNFDSHNFRTAPPIGRVQGANALMDRTLSYFAEHLEERTQVLVSPVARHRSISPFFVSKNQALTRFPDYLREEHDPYGLKSSCPTVDEIFVLWHEDVDYSTISTEMNVETVLQSHVKLMNEWIVVETMRSL